jgi:hypothetical protein
VNFHPTFEYLEGLENTESGQSFWNWMEYPAREEGELREEPVDYGRFDEEDADGFKHRDYLGYGHQRRGQPYLRDERRREEAEQAKDAFGLPIYGMTKPHYDMHYLPTGRLVERPAPTEGGPNETNGSEHDQSAGEAEQEEAEEAETRTTQSPTMHTRRRDRSRTPSRRLNVLSLMLIAGPTTEALNQQAGMMTTGTETMTAYLPTAWTIIAIAAVSAVIVVIATTAMKESGREKQTNVPKRKEPNDKRTNIRGSSATPKSTRIGNHKSGYMQKMTEAHAEGREIMETELTKTWEEIQRIAQVKFLLLAEHTRAPFDEKTKKEDENARAQFRELEDKEEAERRSHAPTDEECPWNKVGIICRCASAHERDPIGYEKVTQRINRPRSSTMMGISTFSAITLIAPTAEALNQQANMMTTATETMTAYLPTILTMIALAAITAIITAAAATKEGAGPEK